MKKLAVLVALSLFISLVFPGISAGNDGNIKEELKDITFDKIYPHALRGDIKKVLEILDYIPNENLTQEQVKIKEKYYGRFREQNVEGVARTKDEFVRDLIKITQDYWRKAFLGELSLTDAQEELLNNIVKFLFENNVINPDDPNVISPENLKETITKALKARGYFSRVGRIQPYLDLIIWQKETVDEYVVELPEGRQKVKVVFMEDFLTLGWEEYATFGRYHPGGWAKKEAIYCVKKSYDTSSEDFGIGILIHEGQHFLDNKVFPKLEGVDLEYRAKLAELCKAKETIYGRIRHFVENAKYDKKHLHQFAEYCLIRDLSKILFNQDFISDMKKWEAIPHEKINEASTKLLKKHTKELKSAGAETVTELLK